MRKQTLIVMVQLVMDTSLPTKETALEIREKLKMKMLDSDSVNLLEAKMLGCVDPEGMEGAAEYGVVN